MFDLIRTHQQDIMLALCAACVTITLLLFFTRFLPAKQKRIMIFQELVAAALLAFDRAAYRYAGQEGYVAHVMVRLSNFMVFFLTSGIVMTFNLFIIERLSKVKEIPRTPKRLSLVSYVVTFGMIMAVIAHFAGLYYYIDADNNYHRGPFFLLAYVVPILCPLIQYSVILQYRKYLSRLIFIAMNLYIFVPIIMALIQIKAYGLSLVNMAMVVVSICMYIFTYLDINDEVERVHSLELDRLHESRSSMRGIFDRIAGMMAEEREKDDPLKKGHAQRVADYAFRLAKLYGMNEEECDKVYYAALLHNVKGIGIGEDPGEEELKEKIDAIVRLCNDYDKQRCASSEHGELTLFVVREEILKGAGTIYDPELTELLVQLIDADNKEELQIAEKTVEKELDCGEYKHSSTMGIEIAETLTRISFSCTPKPESVDEGAPVVLLFDSNDRRVHRSRIMIKEHYYLEYGELWFDGHYICTAARKAEVSMTENAAEGEDAALRIDRFAVTAARYGDHIQVRLENGGRTIDYVIALPDKSHSTYISISGEKCHISDITIEKGDRKIGDGDIRRIADEVSFINRMESDYKNVQIDRFRSAYTEGIPVRDGMRLIFHSMSLPTAGLVWHCPHIVIYTSKDGKVKGEGYREYSVVKLNGENDNPLEGVSNNFTMKKKDNFPGWDGWKEFNKTGFEYQIFFKRNKKRVRYHTENLGLYVENATILPDDGGEVYVTITGDQVALTDIRVV